MTTCKPGYDSEDDDDAPLVFNPKWAGPEYRFYLQQLVQDKIDELLTACKKRGIV